MQTKKLSLRLMLASLVMLVMGVTEAQAQSEMHYVSTPEEFIEHWKANHSIRITCDIDLKSFKEDDMCETYTSELCGYKEVDEEGLYYTLSNIPEMLAKEMEGANIHNIQFDNCSPDWNNNPFRSNYGTSLLARYSKNCTFKNINLTNISINGQGFENASSYGAALVCHDEGSKFTNIYAANCKVWCDGPYAGTLVGEAEGSTFDQCDVHIGCAVYAKGGAINSKAGGFVGTTKNCTFTDCNSVAYVTGPEDGLGGIVGYSINTNFIRCNNYGSVKHGSFVKFEDFTSSLSAMAEYSPSILTNDELEKLVEKGIVSQEYVDKTLATEAVTLLAQGLKAPWYNKCVNIWREACYSRIYTESPHFNQYHKQYNSLVERNVISKDVDEFDFWKEWMEQMVPNDPEVMEIVSDDYNLMQQAKNQFHHINSTAVKVFGVIMTIYTIAKTIYDAQDSDESGGIVGRMEGGTANACCNYGYVFSADAYAGGIAGIATDGAIIKNCLNHGCVKGYEQTGGIVGDFEGSKLSTCLNVGNVSSGNSTSTTFGRIYGDKDSDANVSHNYYSSDHYDEGNTTCAGVTQQMLVSGQTTMLLNQYEDRSAEEEPVWRQTLEVNHFPTLSSVCDVVTEAREDISPVVRTKNVTNFVEAIANQYSDIVLTDDIELNATLANYSSDIMPFVGSIDGQGHRLKGMRLVCTTMNKGGLFNNDNDLKNVGLLCVAQGATFKNLELRDFGITTTSDTKNVGLLVGKSYNCTYDNVHITGGSNISPSGTIGEVGGLVGYSSQDTFTDCSTGPVCNFKANTGASVEWANIGGLVGEAHNSSFLRCINRAAVSSDDDAAGGIVGQSKLCTLERCVNMGTIQGCEEIGGMAGLAEDTKMHMCANTGLIDCIALTQESEVGGIVGQYRVWDSNSSGITECANWGDVHRSAGENQGAIYGEFAKNEPVVHDNYYCFVTEDGDHPAGCVDQAKVLSGEWAYVYDTNRGEMLGTRYYYQDIDRNTFGTHYPVPVAAAGEIFNNWDCKTHNYSYSNLYSAGEDHTTDANKFGICQTCGSVCAIPANFVDIDNSQDMVDLARAVSRGQSFSNHVVRLTSDIDFQGNTTPFLGIGTIDHPFTGVFEGNYHTIKNLEMETAYTVPGLISTVTDWADIRNVIMDSTCVLRSAGWGAGGIVGCTRGSTRLHLTNCGFEGYVSGYKNVGSMLGGTFSVEGATISISIGYCYNTGTVQGDTESASLCGYAATNTDITNSWNAGKVTGYTADHPLARGNYGLFQSYDINATGDNHITAEDVASGQLAYYLNGSVSGYGGEESYAWFQQIGVEEHPTFIRDGDHVVYRHTFRWCDDHQNIITYFDNESVPAEDAMTITHDYGDNGICTRKEGELHFEACPLHDGWWWVTKMGHLYYIAELVNSGQELNSIDLQADVVDNESVIVDGALNPESDSFRQWTPIGNDHISFTKSFQGNNHTISGLYSNPTEQNYQTGLFGQIGGNASVSNVGIKDSYFGNAMYAGAIAGVANADNTGYPSISHCYASDGAVSATMVGGGLVGAYIGGNEPADFTAPITDCYNTCTVSAPDEAAQNTGGIIGALLAPAGFQPTVTADCYYLEGCTTGTSGHGEAKSALAFRLGEVCQLLNKGAWSQAIDKQQSPVFGEGGTSYARNVKPGYWGSLILPFPVTSDEKVQYYTYKNITIGGYELDEGELHLQKAEVVPANTPCFFRTSDDCDLLSATAAANSVVTPSSSLVAKETYYNSKVYLIGSYDDITVERLAGLEDNYYVAQNKLWWGERAFNLGAFRSYVKKSDLKYSAKSLSFVIDDDDETTGITTIDAGQWNGKLLQNGKVVIVKNGVKYNAAGQRIL